MTLLYSRGNRIAVWAAITLWLLALCLWHGEGGDLATLLVLACVAWVATWVVVLRSAGPHRWQETARPDPRP